MRAIFHLLLALTTPTITLALPLDIKATSRKGDAGELLIYFTLQNTTTREIRAFTSQLPWKIHSQSTFILRTKSGALIESKIISFGYPPPGDTVIRPAESISGSIKLTTLFPEATKLLAEGDVMLFWSYWLDIDEATVSDGEIYGGAMIVPGSKSEPRKPTKAR